MLLAGLVLLVAAVGAPLAAQPGPPSGAGPATIATPPPAPPPLAAQSSSRPVPRLALELFDSVMSPFCPGLLLANCPSPSADSLRSAIVERVERGGTREEIEAELYATYGEAVRAAPKASGLGLVAWLAPAVVLLGGGLWLALWLRRASTRRAPRAAAVGPTGPALVTAHGDAARAEELARLDRVVRGDGRP